MAKCFVCGRYCNCDPHHIFGGGMKPKSGKYGLVVPICRPCHSRLHDQDPQLKRRIKQYGQRRAMEENNWTVDEFRKEFHKNYL